MAKTRAQLITQSDNTFQDSPPANITPPNHRQFNQDVVDSAANLEDSNSFEGENTFNADTTFNGVNSHFNLVVNNQRANAIQASQSVDLTSIDGNIIFIAGSTQIDEFVGDVGQIMYATFLDAILINAQGGDSVLPANNIYLNINDSLVFVFTTTNTIRILGKWNAIAQNYYELSDIQSYYDLANSNALQKGAWYVIPQGYVAGGGLSWDVKFMALSGNIYSTRMYLGNMGIWYPAIASDNTLEPSTVTFTNGTDGPDALDWDNFTGVASTGQYQALSYAAINDPLKLINARGYFCGDSVAQNRNILNLGDSNKPYFGRMAFSQIQNQTQFFSHDGTDVAWGNNFETEGGLGAETLRTLNQVLFNNEFVIQEWSATYHIVNDTCTINFQAVIEAKFDKGPSGHEVHLYIPLPFESVRHQSGSGSVRFIEFNNNEDSPALVLPYDAIDPFYVLFSSKWKNAINAETDIQIVGNYTYKITGN
jgi:hypothetical protein